MNWHRDTLSEALAPVTIIALITCLSALPTPGQASDSSETRYAAEQHDASAWLVKPSGARFFSLGVCCVNPGTSAKDWDAANPAYAAWQHYPDNDAWALATVRRLKKCGFTTVGGWSDFRTLSRCPEADLAFAPVLHIGASAGAPWWDMWDPKVVARLDAVARENILPFRDDARVIGYYTDNEIGWWNAILFKMTLEQAPGSGQRQRLIVFLRTKYGQDWSALMQDFEPAPLLESWEELERHGMLYLKPGGNGVKTEREFLGVLAERYYALVHDAVRRYDPGALVLGDRFPSFYYPEVVRACARHVDIVSMNLNPTWSDGTFPRYQLETLHKLSGKPVIIGEFYMAAMENRSGNKNCHGAYPVVATQKDRAAGFRRTITQLLGYPYLVGADWFQYYDEPTHGRFDGENFNFGLVDIHDQPYVPLTGVSANLDLVGMKSRPSPTRPDAARAGVPPAPSHPLSQFEPGLALKGWDRERGFVPPTTEFALADLYVCWTPEAICLGVCAQDAVEDVFYRGKTVLASERAEWVVSPSGWPKPIRGRIGSGMEPVFDEPSLRVVDLSGINGNTRDIAAIALPARLFGRERFRRGDKIGFRSSYQSHGRAYRTDWEGTFILGSTKPRK